MSKLQRQVGPAPPAHRVEMYAITAPGFFQDPQLNWLTDQRPALPDIRVSVDGCGSCVRTALVV